MYYFSKILRAPFRDAVTRVTDGLKAEGFGIITEIDVKKTLRDKIGVEFRNYQILGACNPKLAHEALELEDKIGTMLPCNVVVQECSPMVRSRWRRLIPWRPCRPSTTRA